MSETLVHEVHCRDGRRGDDDQQGRDQEADQRLGRPLAYPLSHRLNLPSTRFGSGLSDQFDVGRYLRSTAPEVQAEAPRESRVGFETLVSVEPGDLAVLRRGFEAPHEPS